MPDQARRSESTWAAVAALAALASAAVTVWALRGNEAEQEANRLQREANAVQVRAAEEQKRVNRAELDRGRKRHASMVMLEIPQDSTAGPEIIDRTARLLISNRSPQTVLGPPELLFAYEPTVGADGVPDGMVSASVPQPIPACTAVWLALPADAGRAVPGHGFYVTDLTLMFFQDSVHWQLTYATGALAGERDEGYSVHRSGAKIDIGELEVVGQRRLDDCTHGG